MWYVRCLFLVFAVPAAHAGVVVYRCTDAAGQVSLQDHPCPDAETEERRRFDAPPAPRAPAAPPLAPLRTASSPAPPTAPPQTAQRTPAPRFLCERYDGETYESSDGVPQQHWVPLWALDADPRAPATVLDPSTIGRTSPLRRTARDGVPAIPVSASTLGTWVEDRCVPLSPAQICERHRARLSEYGRRIFNAGQSEGDRLREEELQLRSTIAAECG